MDMKFSLVHYLECCDAEDIVDTLKMMYDQEIRQVCKDRPVYLTASFGEVKAPISGNICHRTVIYESYLPSMMSYLHREAPVIASNATHEVYVVKRVIQRLTRLGVIVYLGHVHSRRGSIPEIRLPVAEGKSYVAFQLTPMENRTIH